MEKEVSCTEESKIKKMEEKLLYHKTLKIVLIPRNEKEFEKIKK